MEKNRPVFHFAARLFTICALFFALPLLGFGWLFYQSDIAHEKEIARLHVQLELERGIDEVTEQIESDRLYLAQILYETDFHSDDSLKAKALPSQNLFAFEKQGAYWTQIASSTTEPIKGLPHEYLERIAAGRSLSIILGDRLAIAETKGNIIVIMTQSTEHFLKAALSNPKNQERQNLVFSLHPLLQVPSQMIVYKKSVPGTSLYLTASMPKSAITKAVHSGFVYKIGWAALFIIVIFSGMAYFFYRRLSIPFTRFVEGMEKLGKGDFSIRLPEDGKGLELRSLAYTFNSTLDELEATIAKEEKSRSDKERLSKELEWAREIQKELLPPSIPKLQDLEIATHFSPALEVSGDFFDIFQSHGRLLVLLADSSGKGLGPALFSLGLRGALRALLARRGDLAEKVTEANALFCADSKQSGMFTTAVIAEIDEASFEMTYINAGHLPIALKRGANTILLEKNAPAFGLPWGDVEVGRHAIETGSLLALFTDGLTEQIDAGGFELGSDRMTQTLDADRSASENCSRLIDINQQHRQAVQASDDISLIVIRRP